MNVRLLQRGGTVLRIRGVSRYTSTATSINPNENVNTEWADAKPYSNIPGPKPLPIIGNVHRILLGEFDMNNWLNMQKQFYKNYGNIAKFGGLLNRRDILFIYNPDDIAKVYRNEGVWPMRPSFKSLEYYRTVTRKDFFKGLGGVLNDQGEAWQQARTQVNPVMMQTRMVQRYDKPINDVAEDFVTKVSGWVEKNNEMPQNFDNELHKWALESIAFIVLDARLGCLSPNLAADSEPQRMIDSVLTALQCMHIMEVESGLWTIISTPTWRKFVSVMDYFGEVSMKYINKVIERTKTGKDDENGGVLEKFLARDPNPTRAVIMALDMLFAGIDTTSHSTANTLLHLSRNPEKQEKLFNEIVKYVPNPDTPITNEILNEMKYLKACIRESLKCTPIAPANVRTTVSDIVLSGYQIPKGVDLILANGSISQKDENFPEAGKFLPERWLRTKEENPFPDFKANPFVSLPFGHGARKCVGMRFALLEMETLLTKLVRRFRWEWHQPEMRYKTRLVHAPADPLRFTVHKRQN